MMKKGRAFTSCSHCGQGRLQWIIDPTTGGKRLAAHGDGGDYVIHQCPNYKPKSGTATCNRCSTHGLTWQKVEDRFVLYDGALPHDCGEGAPPWVAGPSPATVVCRRCGAKGLRWDKDKAGRNVLYDKDLPHDCGDSLPSHLRNHEPIANSMDRLPDL